MKCSISFEAQQKLRRKIAKDLLDLQDEGKLLNLKEYARSIYDFVFAVGKDHVQSIDYSRMVPVIINQLQANDLRFAKFLKSSGVDYNLLSDLVIGVSEEDGILYMQGYLDISDSKIREELKFLNSDINSVESQTSTEVDTGSAVEVQPEVKKEEEDKKNKVKPLPLINRINPVENFSEKERLQFYSSFTAVAPTWLADAVFEAPYIDSFGVARGGSADNARVPVKSTEFYYAVKRKILNELFRQGVGLESDKMTLGDFNGVYLKPMRVQDVEPSDYSVQTMRYDSNAIMLVLTDQFGDPIRFDENSLEPVLQGGRQAYFATRNTAEIVDADSRVLKAEKLKQAAYALATVKKISQEQAIAQLTKEVTHLDKIRRMVRANPNHDLKFRINGGSLGYITTRDNETTPISAIREELVYEIADDSMVSANEKLKKGVAYVTTPGLHGQFLAIERPDVKNSGYEETIVSLLVDPLTTDINDPLSFETRRELLRGFIDVNNKAGILMGQKKESSSGEYLVSVKGTLLDLSTPKSRDEAKNIIRRFIDEIKPNVLVNKKATHIFKLHVNSLLLDKQIKIPNISNLGDGSLMVTTRDMSYKNFLSQAGFSIATPDVSADGKLRRTNAYFTFDLVEDVPEEIEEETNGVEAEEENVVSEETDSQVDIQQEEIAVETSKDETEPAKEKDLGDLLSDVWSDEELYRRVDQKNKGRDATEKQIAAAKEWYNNHPLSKFVSFKELFHVINQKPGVVASWTLSGITLYKGSNYSDLYHEAWHAFSQAFLNQEQRAGLYNELRSKSGSFIDYKGSRVDFAKANDLQLEEYLAEDFREYMLSPKAKKDSPKRNSFFRKIWNILKTIFGKSSKQDAILDSKSDSAIAELYEKLRVGDISEYSFNTDNASFGLLDQGIIALSKDSEITQLNYSDSQMIVDMVDNFIAEFIDMLNARLTPAEIAKAEELKSELRSKDLPQRNILDANGNIVRRGRYEIQEELKAYEERRTYKYTGVITKSKKLLQKAYMHTRNRLKELIAEQKAKLEKETNITAVSLIEKDIKKLEFAYNNFGDIQNFNLNYSKENARFEGTIGYHLLKSKVFLESDIALDFEDLTEEETFTKSLRAFDRAGNESSLKELAKSEITYLLRTLPKRDKKGDRVLNRFGVSELADFQASWNRLARALAGIQDFNLMYDKLVEESLKYPPFQDLLNKMGDPRTSVSEEETSLWTNFWQTFNKTRIPLIQVTVTEENNTYSAKVGEAFNADYAVGKRWESDFTAARTGSSKYIHRDDEGSYLDTEALLKDFSVGEAVRRPFTFFRSIGFNLTDTDDLKLEMLKRPKLYTSQYFYERILKLHTSGEVIRSLDQITQDLDARYKELQKLEAKYSDQFSNFMVTNAEGNTQFEHSLNNSLTVMVNSINQAESYQSLITQPHMMHLDHTINPFAGASWWLRSVFDLSGDPLSNPDYGKRRQHRGQFVKLKLTNLSGVLLKGITDHFGEGISSASADEYTKLIMDLHLSYSNSPELMRHADKGTSFSIVVDGPILGNDKAGQQYIPIESFKTNHYEVQVVERLMPHLKAEMERIRIMRGLAEDETLRDYDFDYVKKGQTFAMFDNVLTQATKEKLLLADYDVLDKDVELRALVAKDIRNYFKEQYAAVLIRFAEAPFIADNVTAELGNMGISQARITEVFIKYHVYNNWIHNAESLAVIYGDLIQYNELKEEFHKRNAGAGSTGTIYRTDSFINRYIDSIWSSSYAAHNAERLNIKEPFKASSLANTAIVEDQDVRSVYYEELKQELLDKAEAYGMGQNEADGQGMISFDAYRTLKIREGSWSAKQDALFKKIVKGEKITKEDVVKFFPVVKAQYWGPMYDEANDVFSGSRKRPPVMGFHKFSLFPMIPSVIKGTNMEIVHDRMIKENISYLTFKSGSKVGRITKSGKLDTLYESGRTLRSEISDFGSEDRYFTPNVIHLQYLKNQLEIHDEFKGKAIFPTQLRKLIEDGLMKNGVPTDFMPEEQDAALRMQAWEKTPQQERLEYNRYRLLLEYERNIARLTQHAKEELLREIDWSSSIVNGKEHLEGKMENLLGLMRRELSRKDLGEHNLDFLEIGSDGRPKYDLSLSINVEQIEKLLNALIVKRLVKQKVNGEGLIQVASTLLESSDPTKRFTNATKEEMDKYGSNDLPFYRRGSNRLQEIQNSNLDILKITPIQSADRKAVSKSKISNKYIGFADNIAGSSTAHYARQAGELANTGTYNSNDVVFVSVPGARGDANNRRVQQNRTIEEAVKALESGAVILTDNKAYTDLSKYNEGEKRLKQHLEKRKYKYYEITVDGNRIGVWSKAEIKSDSKTKAMKVKVSLSGDFVHLLQLLHRDGKKIGTRERLNEMIKDDSWLDTGRHREMVSLIGVRIPVQGLNSMEFMEVYEFLPTEVGAIIVPPTEIVTKSGTDFDVDKMTIMMPNIRRVKSKKVVSGRQVILPIGTSGSGKSTWAKNLKGDYTIISLDDMRKKLTGDINNKSKDDEIYQEVKIRVVEALKNRKNVIVDTTNLQKERRRELVNAIKYAIPDAEVQYKLMPLDPDLAKERIKKDLAEGVKRADVSDSTIDRHALLYQQALEDIKEESMTDYDQVSEPQMWNWTEEELKEEYDSYIKASKEKYRKELGGDGLSIMWESIFGYSAEDAEEDVKDMVEEAIASGEVLSFDEFKKRKLGSKSIQNDIMRNIRSILELPENFKALLTPNGTDLVDGLADEMKEYVMDYNPLDNAHGEPRKKVSVKGKVKEVISPTRSLEILYNLYKHSSNNVGKQTLGLGAVDNTYNTLFNRIGAFMNPATMPKKEYKELLERFKKGGAISAEERKKLDNYVPQTILMPHNTIDTPNGKAISLSHLYDAKGVNSISNVVNQLINGWVDIAKDAWIFNIQGNKEVSPVLLFMLQAGVPLEDAVYFVSNPLVRQYVKAQKLAKSTFGGPLETAYTDNGGVVNLNFFRSKAREIVLDNPDNGYNFVKVTSKSIKSRIRDLVKREVFFDTASLKSRAKTKRAKITQLDRDIFIHYLHLEDMSKSVRDLKMRTNVDTSRDASLFEAQDRLDLLYDLSFDDRLPQHLVKNIQKTSPISSFFIQRFQILLLGDAFPLRNHKEIHSFIKNEFSLEDIKKTYGAKETAIINWKSDLINFIFQNELRYFDLNSTKYYHSRDIEDVLERKDVFLTHGAYVKDGKMFIDKVTLAEQYQQGMYKDVAYYRKNGLAVLDKIYFESPNDYYHFVLERESIRFTTPLKSLMYSKKFLSGLENVKKEVDKPGRGFLKKTNNESDQSYKQRLIKYAYEKYLAEEALLRTFNHSALFKSDHSYASEFKRIRDTYPELKPYFPLMEALDINGKGGYENLALRDSNLDSDQINILYENLHGIGDTPSLTNRVALQAILPQATQEDINEIVQFFEAFPIVAFLQSGMNTKSNFALTQFVSQEKMLAIIEEPVHKLMNILTGDRADLGHKILSAYNSKFIDENARSRRFTRVRGKNFNINFSILDENSYDKLDETAAFRKKRYRQRLFLEQGRPVFDPKGIKPEVAKELLSADPERVYVYNHAFKKMGIVVGDAAFDGAGPNAIGLSTKASYMLTKDHKETLKDLNGQINPIVKQAIDSQIQRMLEMESQGLKLVFSKRGYGQDMLLKSESGDFFAPQTFLYLSQQLYKNFGFVNPQYLSTATGKKIVQADQEISDAEVLSGKEVTDQMVEDFMKLCNF